MGRTKIEWASDTWNPIRGCSRVSAGCEHCYAEQVARRFSGPGQPYEGLVRLDRDGKAKAQWNGTIRLVPEHLGDPLRWRRPRRVFVNSMSDLFHERVPYEYVAAVFGVMAAAPQHVFQVLTKRPERAAEFFEWLEGRAEQSRTVYPDPLLWRRGVVMQRAAHRAGAPVHFVEDTLWPLPNVWIGVSVEDQASADARIPVLLTLPAAVRWISLEPQLGPVDLDPWLYETHIAPMRKGTFDIDFSQKRVQPPLDWIVVGGESGSGARPFDLAWARSTIAQCRDAGVPAFVKQLGANPIDSALCDVWCNGHHHYTRPPTDGIVAAAKARPGYRVTPHVLSRLLRDRKGGDMAEWPEDLRVREMPATEPIR